MRKKHLKIIELLDTIRAKYASLGDEWEAWLLDNRVLQTCNLLKGETVYYYYHEDKDRILYRGKLEKVVQRIIYVNENGLDVGKVFIYHPLIFSEIVLK